MHKSKKLQLFHQEVHQKYLVYNTLFSRLPYDKMHNIGTLMPFLYDYSKSSFEENKNPIDIVKEFFEKYTTITDKKEQIDLLFKFIKYIERQVVLFDSIEDASFEKLFPKKGKGTLQYLVDLASQTGKTEELKDKIRHFKTKLVFTAHPTQFYPNTVLRILHFLEEKSKENDIAGIDELLQQLGKTPFINRVKPTPVEEAQSILYFLRHVFYTVVNEVHTKIYSEILPDDEFKPVLELGFWPGGDRDGNPFVTCDVTTKVAQELRSAILKCYYNHIKEVRRKLTFDTVHEMLQELQSKVYNNMFALENDLTTHSLLQKLYDVRKVLVERHNSIFIEKLDSLIQSVKTFGLYFASLDIRQDSSIHEKIMQQINQKNNISEKPYSEWNDDEKLDFLLNYDYSFSEDDFEDELTIDTFKTVQLIRELQQKNGERSCHRYIISNSTSQFSVLEVYALFRFAGYEPGDIKVNIVPLFETVQGLSNSKEAMKALYELEPYKKHLKRRHNFQDIMLGFSDGTKDGGYLKANWGIYETKEILSNVSKEYGIKVVFFDGRGGPPARGGGKTHQFYASQGQDIANHEIQLTIQGQTISSMFGSRVQARYNFEQLLTAGISNDVFHEIQGELTEENRKLIQELAEIGLKKYLDLKTHPLFTPYLVDNSPLKYYGSTNIGSRPSKRSSGGEMNLKDLRAIPFVGSWSQIKQNVPGYYGVGTAFQKAIDEGRLEELKNIYSNSLYFRTLVQNSMMALAKSNFSITNYMKNDPKYGEFWQILYDEYKLSLKNVLLISGQESLMDDEPVNKVSVEFRENIILPLLTIQQYALESLKRNDLDEQERKVFEKMVTRTLFGIINAGRNSA
ncbi:MAG: phosphoenolpyruvate carboxylase [Flavobacteriales bacterium]|nr:phosphoenolpyruvate carboxylase [Flavobacteriales bacterium]